MINADTAREAAEMFMNDHDNRVEQALAEIEYFIFQNASRGEKNFTYYFSNLTWNDLVVVLETLVDAGYSYDGDCDDEHLTISW